MIHQRFVHPLTALFIGILLDAAGVALITQSHLGVSAVSVLPYILSIVFPFGSYGTWYYIFQIILMLLLLLSTRVFKKEYVLSFITGFCFSFVLDIATACFQPLPSAIFFRIIYFMTGSLLLMIGVAFLLSSHLPIMPQDLFTKEFSSFLKIPYQKCKTSFDIICVTAAVLISLLFHGTVLGVGIGTIIGAGVNGIGIAYFSQKLNSK